VLGGGIACGAFYIAVVLAPVWPLVMVCTVGLGFGFYMMHNTMQTRATEMAPQSRGTALALYSSAWALGQAVGVALSSVVVAAIGVAPMIALFGTGVALFGVWFRSNLHRFP
jgi:predicted MFS family arabinose efflux permease